MKNVFVHADDYGYTLNTSKGIIECIKKDALDSISIICNTSYFEESMNVFFKEIPSFKKMPTLCIHINLVEGINISNTNLISKNGYNNFSWIKALINSFIFNIELKNQIKKEILAQINLAKTYIDKCVDLAIKNNIPYNQDYLVIDSHTHIHMTPMVLNALLEVIEENKFENVYIRNPKEPVSPFITRKAMFTYNPINIIKNLLLNTLSIRLDKLSNDKMYMWGLIMSGKMDFGRIKEILPAILDLSNRRKRKLQILFHPGIALNNEYRPEFNVKYFNDFNTSINREVEKQSLISLRSMMEEQK